MTLEDAFDRLTVDQRACLRAIINGGHPDMAVAETMVPLGLVRGVRETSLGRFVQLTPEGVRLATRLSGKA